MVLGRQVICCGILASVALVAGAGELKVEKLADDIWRVRMERNGVWPESGLNRYGVIADLKAVETGVDLSVLPVRPRIEQTEKGFAVSFPLGAETDVYGLGDVCRTNVMRRGASYEIWMRNVTSYIPVPVALTSGGWGVFVNTTWRNTFDVGKSDPGRLTVSAPQGEVDFYVFAGKDYAAQLDAYTRVTGRPALLPAWGYGFTYVCNENIDMWGLMNEAREFRREGLPCDVIGLEPGWMDLHYDRTIWKRWDPKKFVFPYWNPTGSTSLTPWGEGDATTFVQALGHMGFKLSLWLCCDYDLFRYEEALVAGRAKGVARRAAEGGKVNDGIWMDDRITGEAKQGEVKRVGCTKYTAEERLRMMRAGAETYDTDEPWFEHLKFFVDQGVRCFKLDGDQQVAEHPKRKWANGMSDEQAHNLYPLVYGKQMARGFESYTGTRSMVYSDCGYAGVQQYVATWAGDTGGGVKPLASILNLGLSGHPSQSCDMQIGDPRSRHFGFLQVWSQQNNWAYWKQAWYLAPEKMEAFRAYGRLRYRLFPYLYSAAARASRTGYPAMRPLALVYPERQEYRQVITTYMLGDALLVSAFADETVIPPGVWYDWWTGEKVVGPSVRRESVTETRGGGLYVKAGGVVPMWPLKSHIARGWNDTVEVHCWRGADGAGELYEDDGVTLAYRDGRFALTPLAFTGGELRVGVRTGSFDGLPADRTITSVIHGE